MSSFNCIKKLSVIAFAAGIYTRYYGLIIIIANLLYCRNFKLVTLQTDVYVTNPILFNS